MTTVLLFHHAQGQTPGFLAFAEELREAGHAVHTPDLYGGGETFGTVDEGVARLSMPPLRKPHHAQDQVCGGLSGRRRQRVPRVAFGGVQLAE